MPLNSNTAIIIMTHTTGMMREEENKQRKKGRQTNTQHPGEKVI